MLFLETDGLQADPRLCGTAGTAATRSCTRSYPGSSPHCLIQNSDTDRVLASATVRAHHCGLEIEEYGYKVMCIKIVEKWRTLVANCTRKVQWSATGTQRQHGRHGITWLKRRLKRRCTRCQARICLAAAVVGLHFCGEACQEEELPICRV